MASVELVAELRRKAGVVGDAAFNDDDLSALIDSLGSVNMAAAEVWSQKAASSAALVDVSESGSSRSMSQAYKNALAMATHFRGLDAVDTSVEVARHARTRAIVREGE